jgi:hypothetical protein
MKRLVSLIVLVVACHDDHPQLAPDAPPDTPPPVTTLTSYVIDLVVNHSSDTSPRPFAEFATLDDPDQGNPAAYASLFP